MVVVVSEEEPRHSTDDVVLGRRSTVQQELSGGEDVAFREAPPACPPVEWPASRKHGPRGGRTGGSWCRCSDQMGLMRRHSLMNQSCCNNNRNNNLRHLEAISSRRLNLAHRLAVCDLLHMFPRVRGSHASLQA